MTMNVDTEDKARRGRVHFCFSIAVLNTVMATGGLTGGHLNKDPKKRDCALKIIWGQSFSCRGKVQGPELGRQVAFSTNGKSTLDEVQ